MPSLTNSQLRSVSLRRMTKRFDIYSLRKPKQSVKIVGWLHMANSPSDSLDRRSRTPVVVVDSRKIPLELIKGNGSRQKRFIALIYIHTHKPFHFVAQQAGTSITVTILTDRVTSLTHPVSAQYRSTPSCAGIRTHTRQYYLTTNGAVPVVASRWSTRKSPEAIAPLARVGLRRTRCGPATQADYGPRWQRGSQPAASGAVGPIRPARGRLIARLLRCHIQGVVHAGPMPSAGELPCLACLPRSQGGSGMARPRSVGPSRNVILWTVYLLSVVTALTALYVFVTGDFLAGIAASMMVWRALAILRYIRTRR